MNEIKSLIKKLKIQNAQWKTQSCDSKSALFYKLSDVDEGSYSQFLERIKTIDYAYIFVSTDKKYKDTKNISFLPFSEWCEVQKQIMDELYPLKKQPQIIAVTGTNGKTTTVDFIRQIAIESKVNVLAIGTLGVWHNDKKMDEFGLTTPSYIDLRKYFYKYESELIVFEASSHAIAQKRFYNLELDAAVWTSFSQDHLDYHKTMQEYYDVKLDLRNYLKNKRTFYIHKSDEHHHSDLESFQSIDLNIQSKKDFLKISYNRKNLELAISALEEIEVTRLDSYDFLLPAEGRFNTYSFKTNLVIIDYAHTPDAVKSICLESKKSFSKNVVTVFGCGGDRDRTKRPLMGQAACSYSDEVIITSDNPRFEDPSEILKNIESGLDKYSNYKIIEDRVMAIKESLKNENSVILILGKGHEPYFDIQGEKRPYSDIDLIKELIK